MELKSGGIKDKHMSMADEIFINMCRDILENGTSTEGEKVRPHWPDGTSAYTIKKVRRSQPLRLIEGISAPDASPHRFKERDGRDFVDLAAEIQ